MSFRTDIPATPLKSTSVFTPITVGNMKLSHKVVLAPMTRFRNKNYVPTQTVLTYYDQRSKAPGTLLITEGTYVSPASAGFYPGSPGIWAEDQIQGWKRVFDRIHANGSFVFQQIFAMGRSARAGIVQQLGIKLVGPSAVYATEEDREESEKNGVPLQALSVEEIEEYITAFVDAAKNSVSAGADGVEIHAGNGYFLNQFLDPGSNVRKDKYGGDIENRCRLVLEIIDETSKAIGAEKVGLRIFPFGTFGGMSGVNDLQYKELYFHLLTELEKRASDGQRIAYVHIVGPRAKQAGQAAEGEETEDGVSSDFMYEAWKGIIMKNGNYASNPKLAIQDTADGRSLLSYGRVFASNPDLPVRLAEGFPLTQYDRALFYAAQSGATGYTDYKTYDELVNQGKV